MHSFSSHFILNRISKNVEIGQVPRGEFLRHLWHHAEGDAEAGRAGLRPSANASAGHHVVAETPGLSTVPVPRQAAHRNGSAARRALLAAREKSADSGSRREVAPDSSRGAAPDGRARVAESWF